MINVTADGDGLWLTGKIKNVTTRSHESISLESIQRPVISLIRNKIQIIQLKLV